jgi:hypothetical protein
VTEPRPATARAAVLPLAAVALIATLLAVLTAARYTALIDQARAACGTAAALDLTRWVDLCREVQYQQ